jgi:heme-degrading monooxygenase HmoA
MYGTIARLRVQPGMEDRFEAFGRETERRSIPGWVASSVYRSDNDPSEFWLVVAFESKEAYQANASGPEQHKEYQRLRAMLQADPEWHDGEVLLASRAATAGA